LIYAGFWRRFGAFWLDFLVLLPLAGLNRWGTDHYRMYWVYDYLPLVLFSLFYNVYLVRRFGGTPGKLILRLQIKRTDGTAIGYREAILRYLPECLANVAGSLGMVLAAMAMAMAMTDADYFALPYHDRIAQLTALRPPWTGYATIAASVWVYSEFIVMLTNEKRRALHDFIAGTIVIVRASYAESVHGKTEGASTLSVPDA
jgi:uncharacterized RDD family membrane protein YckC